ncbi:type II toxin-antitoxin system RelE/ParE family toxin [Chryseobacterium sp. Ch-15]|uniref:Toxin n=1 Tax=Chryseobacterium muglaense TaxID=2893752 RepID=A0A9Q3YWV6_9FLAO|nr:type II toxin-antitoxin system RelE/ParE family toxin [Chryseobacterium muglaense]MBD3903239.1 type II toxin-antitoxin system RelE/ParE family toxin [Chryseobacterium muglaense]MCC9036070.1 type II toxin-antitoxin system RelE/ParE family toxin [Chryseobacterium muglaense]MCM2553354.1 type II toxin-antitoxin system RelE/ParE family toxin [Chryseobacterium muglaense]
MKYRISKEALNDLEKIWLYTSETWSKEQADYYFDLIINEIEYLSGNPKSGKDYNEIRKGYFRSRVKSHFIFYRINIKNEEIEIIRILHQQMDISSRLSE